MGWHVAGAFAIIDAASCAAQGIAAGAVLALALVAALFAAPLAHFRGEGFSAFTQIVERGVLRGLRAFKVAAAQRVFGAAHGFSGVVERVTRRCACLIRHALRLADSIADLRLALRKFVAALAALLLAAAAALAVLLFLLLSGFVAELALFAHGLGKLVHALLHLLILLAVAVLALGLLKLHIHVGEDLREHREQLLGFGVAALLGETLHLLEQFFDILLANAGLVLRVLHVLALAVAERFLNEGLHVGFGRLAERFDQLTNTLRRRALRERLCELALGFFERPARIGGAAILSAQRRTPKRVRGNICFADVVGGREFGTGDTETQEDREIAEIAVFRRHGQRIEETRRLAHAFGRALEIGPAFVVPDFNALIAEKNVARGNSTAALLRRLAIGAALSQDMSANFDRSLRERLQKDFLWQREAHRLADAFLAERVEGDDTRFHFHAGVRMRGEIDFGFRFGFARVAGRRFQFCVDGVGVRESVWRMNGAHT